MRTRFDHAEDLNDITEVISTQQRALRLTPDGHPNLPSRHLNLGRSLYKRSVKTSSSEDVNMNISHFHSAATSTFGAPKARLEAAQCWAWVLNDQNPLSPDVLSAFDTFIHQLKTPYWQVLQLHSGLSDPTKRRNGSSKAVVSFRDQ